MERLFGAESATGRQVVPALRRGMNKGVSLVRYADDFVVTAPNRAVLEGHVLPVLGCFLSERGLKLNEAKTRIVHVDEGFDFLGFNIRRFGRKVLTKPQKEKVALHLRGIRDFLVRNRQAPTSIVIGELAPVIRGWSNYYRYGASKEVLQYVDYRLWKMLWHWSLRRHHNKPKKWVKTHYFKQIGWRDWMFHGRTDTGGEVTLCTHSEIPVKRFVKVKGRATPMNPDESDYWERRKRERLMDATYSKRRKYLLQRQGGACAMCGVQFDPDEDTHFIDMHHDRTRRSGGSDQPRKLMAVHRWCHHGYHMRNGYRAAEA
jgi:RNA-directed DNA polymerase